MDEWDLLGIEFIFICHLVPNEIRKQICITCKAQTNLGQSQQIHKLHLSQDIVLTNGAILDGRKEDLV